MDARPGVLETIRGQLVVSCQALRGMPFDAPELIAELARAAELGGAAAVRVNRPENIRAVRRVVGLPIIGLFKQGDGPVYITPTLDTAMACVDAGTDMVATDATARPRPGGEQLSAIVSAVHGAGVAVLGDVGGVEDALFAQDQGVDAVATTLRGHTGVRAPSPLAQLDALVRHVRIPVIMEGGVTSPRMARQAIEHGAWSVVVGRAITMPHFITQMYVRTIARLQERTVQDDDDA